MVKVRDYCLFGGRNKNKKRKRSAHGEQGTSKDKEKTRPASRIGPCENTRSAAPRHLLASCYGFLDSSSRWPHLSSGQETEISSQVWRVLMSEDWYQLQGSAPTPGSGPAIPCLWLTRLSWLLVPQPPATRGLSSMLVEMPRHGETEAPCRQPARTCQPHKGVILETDPPAPSGDSSPGLLQPDWPQLDGARTIQPPWSKFLIG